jgi:lysophospholipase L1-like esterase
VDPRGDAGLVEEHLHELLVGREVTVQQLDRREALEARGALGKRPLTAVITAQGDAFGEAAQGDRGVLTGDQAVMVTAAVGGAALRLIPDVLAAVRDGEAAAQKALRELVGRVKASAVLAPAAPVPPPAQNLSEHMAAERASMVEALEATRWDRGAAAERMGMSRRTFYRRMTEYGLLEGAKPRVVVLMIGTNNFGLHGDSPQAVLGGINAIVETLRRERPAAKVLLLDIFPRGNPGDPLRRKVMEANRLLEAYAKENPEVTRLRIWDEFMNEDGTLPPEVMPDKLHLSEKGYAIWAEAMLPALQHLLAAP